MEYPTLLYKVPGPHALPKSGGVTYRYIGCADEQEFERLSDLGWHVSIDAASGKVDADKVLEAAEALEAVTDDVSPSARDELEQRAKALGVSFNARTKDETLIARIAEASA